MLMKKIILLLLVSMIFPFASAEINVDRVLPQTIEQGNNIEIELNISFEGEEISSLIVTEEIPEGWEIIKTTPKATAFEGKVKWLLYNNALFDGLKLKYTLKAPSNFEGTQEINGYWKSLLTKSTIEGDLFAVIIVPELVPEPEPKVEPPVEDNTMLIIIAGFAVVILLLIVLVVKKKK